MNPCEGIVEQQPELIANDKADPTSESSLRENKQDVIEVINGDKSKDVIECQGEEHQASQLNVT